MRILAPALLLLMQFASAFVLSPAAPIRKRDASLFPSQKRPFQDGNPSVISSASARSMSSQAQPDEETVSSKEDPQSPETPSENNEPSNNPLQTLQTMLQQEVARTRQRPPLQVDDENLLLYDVFLLINLSVSISFWVTHRMQLDFVGLAFNEGCLLALCWVAAGLWNGAFLRSAVDGNHRSTDDQAGPKAAGLLALNTFVGATNLRLLFALSVAVVQHRPALSASGGEELLPLELGFGLLLMIAWRTLHSSITPRI